jgi:hypothetical protein
MPMFPNFNLTVCCLEREHFFMSKNIHSKLKIHFMVCVTLKLFFSFAKFLGNFFQAVDYVNNYFLIQFFCEKHVLFETGLKTVEVHCLLKHKILLECVN